MLHVHCEACRAPYQIDERRVPAAGLKMRCPKCGHSFTVQRAGGEAAPPPTVPQRPAVAAPAASKEPAQAPARHDSFGELDLPMRTMMGSVDELLGSHDFGALDLPTAADDLPAPAAELPSPVAQPRAPRPAAPQPAAQPPATTAPRAPQPPADFADLPAPAAELPVARDARGAEPGTPGAPGYHRAGTAVEVGRMVRKRPKLRSMPDTGMAADLPAPVPLPSEPVLRPTARELPAVVAGRAAHSVVAELPSTRKLPPESAAPATRRRPDAQALDFGELELPDSLDPLPSVFDERPRKADELPSVFDERPVPSHAFPATASALPVTAGSLPASASALPVTAGSLPASANAFPVAANSLPASSDPRPLPKRDDDPFGLGDDFGFGDLELPRAPEDDAWAPPMPGAPHAESAVAPPPSLDDMFDGLAPPPSQPPSLPPALTSGAHAQLPDFGELDLGPIGAAPAQPGMVPAAVASDRELPLPPPLPAGGAAEGAQSRSALAEARIRRSRTRGRVLLVGLALLALAGGALELTDHGAFGHRLISDQLNRDAYALSASTALDTLGQGIADDAFGSYTKQASALLALHEATPRAWGLTAVAAYAENLTLLRFGDEASRRVRAEALLAGLGKVEPTPYLVLAQAAAARTPAEANAQRARLGATTFEPALATEASLLEGELALLAEDWPAALSLFAKARAQRDSARARYGETRAQLRLSPSAARAAAQATLELASEHSGAHLVLAQLLAQEDERGAAERELARVLEGPARDQSSPRQLARAFALKGFLLARSGKNSEAQAAYEEALRRDPSSADALIGQGNALFANARYTEALARFDGALKLSERNAVAVAGAARSLLKLEKPEEAFAILQSAREAHPNDMALAYWLGEAKRSVGKLDEAAELYTRAEELIEPLNPDAVLPFVAHAKLLSQRGDDKLALDKLGVAKTKLPASVALDRAFGDLAASGGHYETAIAHYRDALGKDSNDLALHFRLAELLRKAGKLSDAERELSVVAAADKDYPGLSLERGVLLEQSGKLESALAEFKGALATAPTDPDLMLRVGAAYLSIGHPLEATPLLEGVLKQRPQSAEANHYLGRAYLLRGNPYIPQALRLLRRAAELDANQATYHVYVAWAANESMPPQLGLAHEATERALALDKQEAGAYWQRGVTLRKEGAIESALGDLRRAVALRPEQPELHASLAEGLDDQAQYGAALVEWQRAVAGNARPAFWRYRLGRSLSERGNVAEGARHLAYAVTEGAVIEPRPGWLTQALFEAAEAARRSGNRANAVAFYKDYLASAPASAPDRRDAEQHLKTLRD